MGEILPQPESNERSLTYTGLSLGESITGPSPCLENPNRERNHLEEKVMWRNISSGFFHFNESFYANLKFYNMSAYFGDA